MINVMIHQCLYVIVVLYMNILECISSQTTPVNEKEVSVGSVISIQLNRHQPKKVLKTFMPNWMVSIHNDSVFEGVPTSSDVGVHVIPELNLAVRVKPEVNTFEHCVNRLSPTGVLVAIDAEPSHLSASARVNLLRTFASHLQLSPETNLKFLSSSASATLQTYLYRLASGPGDVPTVKRISRGGFIVWRVGCGAIPASGLDMLQRMEKSAVTGELHRVIGYPVLHWLVGDDHTRSVMLRRRRLLLRRKRLADAAISGNGKASSSSDEDVGSGMAQDSSSMEGSGMFAPGTKSPSNLSSVSTMHNGISTRSPLAITSKISGSSDNKGGREKSGVTTVTDLSYSSEDKPKVISSSTSSTSTTTSTTPVPTTTPDSIPVVVHDLRRIVVAVGDSLSFKIPRSAFNDTEDGSENLSIMMFKEGATTPLDSDHRNWISFDKNSVELRVSQVTESRMGTHKFVVCAYDRKGNKVCANQIVEVVNTYLTTKFTVHKGEYFRKFIRTEEINYVEKKLNSKTFELRISSDAASWIKINTTDRKVLGVVPNGWSGTRISFKLVAEKGDKRTALVYEMAILHARLTGVTHVITMVLNVPFAMQKKSDLSLEFAMRVCEATGIPIEKFMLIRVAVNPPFSGSSRSRRSIVPRNATIKWSNRGIISVARCLSHAIQNFIKRMVDFEIATDTLIYQRDFKNKMKPFRLYEPIAVKGYGKCMNVNVMPELTTTSTSTSTTTTTTTTTTPAPTTTTKPTPKVPHFPKNSTLTSLTVFKGLAFRSRLKINNVDVDPAKYDVIFSRGDNTVTQSSWIQLEWEDLSLYGLPLQRNLGVNSFKLDVVSKANPMISLIRNLTVTVIDDERQHLRNNLVRMQLRKYKTERTTESFRKPVLFALKFRLDLVRLLGKHLEGASCAGNVCEKNIAIQQMSVDTEGNLVFEWSWRALYESAVCDKKKFKRLNTRLFAWDGKSRVVLDELKKALKKLEIVATSVNVLPSGSCRGKASLKKTTPSTVRNPTHTRRPAQVPTFGRMIPNFLVVAVIPICAFLILVLVVALIVACCLHHKRKMHMRRRRGIDKPKRAVVFEEEMDEHPNHASKPLILPNEKPPLPPPDYATEIMPPPLLGHEEHIPLTTTSPYRHATNGGSTFRPNQPPMINT